MSDLTKAMMRDLDAADKMFNIEGIVPEKTSKPCIWNLTELDGLIRQFPKDYRPYLFRGLYYLFFTSFKEDYYPKAMLDFQRAAALNPASPLPQYFIGAVYSKASFWTKKAWTSDVGRRASFSPPSFFTNSATPKTTFSIVVSFGSWFVGVNIVIPPPTWYRVLFISSQRGWPTIAVSVHFRLNNIVAEFSVRVFQVAEFMSLNVNDRIRSTLPPDSELGKSQIENSRMLSTAVSISGRYFKRSSFASNFSLFLRARSTSSTKLTIYTTAVLVSATTLIDVPYSFSLASIPSVRSLSLVTSRAFFSG